MNPDEEVFESISKDFSQNTGFFVSVIRCGTEYLRSVDYNSLKLRDNLEFPTNLVKIKVIHSPIDVIGSNLLADVLNIFYFEIDYQTNRHSWEENRERSTEKFVNLFQEIDKRLFDTIVKKRANVAFLMSHKVAKISFDTRVFGLINRQDPSRVYALYGIHRQ
jgi:hypothetical protein